MEKNYNNGVGGKVEDVKQEMNVSHECFSLSSADEKEHSLDEIIAQITGCKYDYDPNGCTQGYIYKFAGRNDYVVNITFHRGSESEKRYGDMMTGCFYYTLEERDKLEKDGNALDGEPKVKVVELLGKYDEDTTNELKKIGIDIKDIALLYCIPMAKECNTFPSKNKREVKMLEVPVTFLGNGKDIGWMYNFFKKMVTEHVALTPDEYSSYLAYKFILEREELTDEEREIIFDEKNAIKSSSVAYHLLAWKEECKTISDKEKEILGEIRAKNFIERYKKADDELKKMGLSMMKLGKKYPEKLKLLLNKIFYFSDRRYNIVGKHLLYCNFNTILHIYLRHVEELKVENQFSEKDKFQLKEEDVLNAMQIVMHKLNDEYQNYKDKQPQGRFVRYGKEAYYYNGDYYNVVVNVDGSISTFYKASRIKTNE